MGSSKITRTFVGASTLVQFASTVLLLTFPVVSPASYPGSHPASRPPPGNTGSNNPEYLQPQFVYDDKITLSGFSSGGTFAQMLQFSYSSLFSGIAVFSHSALAIETYYRCGPPDGNLTSYDSLCTMLFNFTQEQLYNPDLVHRDIQDYERRGLIESTWNLRNKRLYVYAGLKNFLFTPRQSLSTVPIYERYIGNPDNIFVRIQDSNLVMPTSGSYGSPCTEASETTFFIGRCNFSGAREALNFLLFSDPWSGRILNGDETQAASTSGGFGRPRVSTFDQTEFTQGLQNHQMDTQGYYYIPRQCKAQNQGGFGGKRQRCYLHFYFHGCLAGKEFANTNHVENTGLLEIADRKGIILIFPQANSSLPNNEIGCWDTFGIGGVLYATQRGPQITAVKRMLDRILGKTENLSFGSSSSWPFQFPSTSSDGNRGSGTARVVSTNGNNNGFSRKPPTTHRYSPYLSTNSKPSSGHQQSQRMQQWPGSPPSASWRQSSYRL